MLKNSEESSEPQKAEQLGSTTIPSPVPVSHSVTVQMTVNDMSDVEGLEFFATHANGHFASAACGLQYN
ncbi:MAG: hypothetical protein RLY93_00590 [Sumerlaeia bacterium]